MRELRYQEVRLSTQCLSEFPINKRQRAKDKKGFWPFDVQLRFYVSSFLEVCLAILKAEHGTGLTGHLRGPV